MSKVAHYLQEHLLGEVLSTPEARKYFATDGSIFGILPQLIVYPKNENDIRKTARFTWQLAERGRTIPITPRGFGTDVSGAAIGNGIVMVFPAHLNRILELDNKSGAVTVEPGISHGKLQQTLQTHGRFLPPISMNSETATIGGAIGNNDSGDSVLKYGQLKRFVKELRVVLANGEVIEAKRISKRELNKKLGLATFEGEIYRSLDTLIEENSETIKTMGRAISRNTAGYEIAEVKRKDGSFDLTPLIVGSQGTLGIVTEAVLTTEIYNPSTTLVAGFFDDVKVLENVIKDFIKLPDQPRSVEIVDEKLLSLVEKFNPNQLKGVLGGTKPKIVLLVEFDNLSVRVQKKLAKKVQKILNHYQVTSRTESDDEGKEQLQKIRQAVSTVVAHTDNQASALPILDDGIVPTDKMTDFISGVYEICERNNLKTGIWGHGADANLRLRPFLDLSQVGDRQRLFKVMDEYYGLIISLGGSISTDNGDGRIRAPYVRRMYGDDTYQVFQKIKHIFDPYGTMNPGVKINVTKEDIKPLLRPEYSLRHHLDYLPRS